MNKGDFHSALVNEPVAKAEINQVESVLVRSQWGKHKVGFGLHVNPNSFTTAGLQHTDFLAYLGFERSHGCPFTTARRCYCKGVSEEFDVSFFARMFQSAFGNLKNADRELTACGFELPQPEAWGYFAGKPSGRTDDSFGRWLGNGHSARSVNRMKQTEDENFYFRFNFVVTDHGKAFVTHYRPKHLPVSSEILSVLRFLRLERFPECPEFDFEPCFYRAFEYKSQGGGIFDSNTEYAHGRFDAHDSSFSKGIESLLTANTEVESFGMGFLPFDRDAAERLTKDIEQKVLRPLKSTETGLSAAAAVKSDTPSDFDVAISVAKENRHYARELAELVREAGFAVFYDEFFPEYLWGKDLAITFDEIFRKRSRYCVVFVSSEYRDRVWTFQELRSVLARAVEEKGNEYILPVRIDSTELPGLQPTIAYLSISEGIQTIAELLIAKLGSR